MPDVLNLYVVGANGRVQLGDLAAKGDFYTAEKDTDGSITLMPVRVNTTSTKRTPADDTDGE